MPRRCPPNTICFNNISLIFIVFLLIVIFYLIYLIFIKMNVTNKYNEIITNKFNTNKFISNENNGLYSKPNYSYSNIQNDILLNPYVAPLKDERYKIPINISTRSIDSTYRQMGILKSQNGNTKILPLMGRPLFPSRDKWNYYTISETNNMIKLPISFKQKSCTNEYGCDNLYNGDVVYVEGYDETFIATIYDNDTYRYIPVI